MQSEIVFYVSPDLERSMSSSLVSLEASNAELEKYKMEQGQLRSQLDSVRDEKMNMEKCLKSVSQSVSQSDRQADRQTDRQTDTVRD